MNKIGDGKSSFLIDLKKLFSNHCMVRRFNGKALLIRCSVAIIALFVTVILTLMASGAFKQSNEGAEAGNLSEPEITKDGGVNVEDDKSINVGEQTTEELTQGKENGEQYSDMSYKEHGEVYVINKTGSPVVYDPNADYEKYYVKNEARPLVLILHTDDEQKYSDESGIVDIGERIAQGLSLSGIPAIHCSAKHKGDTDTDSYNNAEESIKFYLEMYPSIKYIFDIGIDNETECATKGTYEGYEAAQLLFDVCGQNYDTREQNLYLAVKLRGMLNRGDMSVAREITMSRSVLNSGYSPYYLTIKIGTRYNSAKEAKNSANAFVLTFAEHLNKQ